MNRQLVALALVVASLLGGGAAVAPAASARTLPVVYGLPSGNMSGSNFFNPQVRPHGLVAFECDGFSFLRIGSYRNWTATSASGAGSFHARANTRRVRWLVVATTFTFSGVQKHNGRRYFSRLRLRLARNLGAGRNHVFRFERSDCPAWGEKT